MSCTTFGVSGLISPTPPWQCHHPVHPKPQGQRGGGGLGTRFPPSAYKDLQSREETRNAAWRKRGWDENVYYTGEHTGLGLSLLAELRGDPAPAVSCSAAHSDDGVSDHDPPEDLPAAVSWDTCCLPQLCWEVLGASSPVLGCLGGGEGEG